MDIRTSFDELVAGSLAFEERHNSRYRYSKLGGKTPQMALIVVDLEGCQKSLT